MILLSETMTNIFLSDIIKMDKKTKRCPPGFRKSKITGDCESIVERKTKVKTRQSKESEPQQRKAPRKSSRKLPTTKPRTTKPPTTKPPTTKPPTTKPPTTKPPTTKSTIKTEEKPSDKIDIIVLENDKSKLTRELLFSYYEFCRFVPNKDDYAVSDDYFEKSFNKAEFVFITMPIEIKKDNNGVDIGKGGIAFVSTIDNKKALTIQVLCAKRFGEHMMKEIISWAKKKHFHYIKIESVWNAIGFYRKLGFRFIKTCGEKEDSTLKDMGESQSHKRFINRSEHLKDDEFVSYLYELYKKGFCHTYKRPIFDHYKSQRSVAKKCNKDGYDMILCL
jgi:hypothetical protein